MKKMLIFAALLFATAAMSQELKFKVPSRDTLRLKAIDFVLPDSLAHMTPWRPSYKTMEPIKTHPSASMTSVVIPERKRNSRVIVLDNNTLYLGPHFSISNGQAWNWNPFRHNSFNRSPFPDAYLDARTLSFPMPR